jgi:hypothetical protein
MIKLTRIVDANINFLIIFHFCSLSKKKEKMAQKSPIRDTKICVFALVAKLVELWVMFPQLSFCVKFTFFQLNCCLKVNSNN